MSFNWIEKNKPALVLAPMEGVTDYPMRTLLTERGGFSYCVAEFLRISQELLPKKVYLKHAPELNHGAKTFSQVPVQIQLLGGNAELMAKSAQTAIELGALAIDINFGCPAPTVNRNDGGATLLKYPERIKEIVKAVREAVPSHIPVSAKLRLGWDNMDSIFTNAKKAQDGGASWITIHARTKTQGYAPPAHWKYIGEVQKQLSIPVVANGEIWTLEDFKKCQVETNCEHFMIGRGALANPSLQHQIAHELGLPIHSKLSIAAQDLHPIGIEISDWAPLLTRFIDLTKDKSPDTQYTVCRIKQWLKMANQRRELLWFDEIKKTKSVSDINFILTRMNEVHHGTTFKNEKNRLS